VEPDQEDELLNVFRYRVSDRSVTAQLNLSKVLMCITDKNIELDG